MKNETLAILSLLIAVLSIINIRFRVLRRKLLTAVTGLHFTFLLFFGLGSFFYAWFGVITERENEFIINRAINKVIPYLLLAYSILSVYEFTQRKKVSNFNQFLLAALKKNVNLNHFNLFVFSLSFVAMVFPSGDIASSGVGTIFPVFVNFLFPITILIVYNLKKRDAFSIVLFVVLFLLVGYTVFTSAWRSQLIMFLGCLLIGWNLKGSVNYYIVGIAFFLVIFILLPFQQIKKSNTQLDFDTGVAFEQSLDYSYTDRLAIGASFFAERINYSREIGYVQNAIDKNYMQYRWGETYKEVFYQLIPRVFWDNKPVYNSFTGREIPRKVGLVSKYDMNTSWAVNSFAEFIYNFPYQYLPVFVILFFFFLNYLDSLCMRLRLKPQFAWLLQTTLFFLSLNLVTVVFSSTYFLWSFVIIIVLNSLSTIDVKHKFTL